MSNLYAYGKLNPKSTDPNPSIYEELPFTHLAKGIQTPFTEDSCVRFLAFTAECVLTINIDLLLGKKYACIFPQTAPKMVFSLRH